MNLKKFPWGSNQTQLFHLPKPYYRQMSNNLALVYIFTFLVTQSYIPVSIFCFLTATGEDKDDELYALF